MGGMRGRTRGSFRLRDDPQGGAQEAVVEEVALLQHLDHGVGFRVAPDLADGLVAVRIELLPERVDFLDLELLEHRGEQARGELNPLLKRLDRRGLNGERAISPVLQAEQLAATTLDA